MLQYNYKVKSIEKSGWYISLLLLLCRLGGISTLFFSWDKKWLLDMLEFKSVENVHFILYKITVCVSHRGLAACDALHVMVGHMKFLIYSLLFKCEGFSVHYISFMAQNTLEEYLWLHSSLLDFWMFNNSKE